MFLDIAIGILLAIGVSLYFNVGLAPPLVWGGIIFALLPDIDFLIELFRHRSVGGKVIKEHRNLTHFPLSYIPLVVLIYLFFGVIWATLFSLAVFLHFLHDSIGPGWGIRWLWPFSWKSYKFFSEKDGEISKNLIVSWSKNELEEAVLKYGDPDWIKNIYLRPSAILIAELSILLIAIIIFIILYYRLYLYFAFRI